MLEAIKNVMVEFEVSVERAMDVLKVPHSERDKYLNRL